MKGVTEMRNLVFFTADGEPLPADTTPDDERIAYQLREHEAEQAIKVWQERRKAEAAEAKAAAKAANKAHGGPPSDKGSDADGSQAAPDGQGGEEGIEDGE